MTESRLVGGGSGDPRDAILSRVQEYAVMALVVLTPLAFYKGAEEAFLSIKLVVAEVCLLVFMLATLVRRGVSGSGRTVLFPASWLILLLLAGFSVSAGLAAPLQLPAGFGVLDRMPLGADYAHLVFFVLGFLLLSAWERDDTATTRILLAAIATATLTAVYGLMQFIGLDPLKSLWVEHTVAMQRGIFSTLGNANMLSGYLAALLPLVVAWFLTAPPGGRKIGWGAVALVFATTILVTGTRGAWLGGVVSLAIMIAVLVRRAIVPGAVLLKVGGILLLVAVLLSVAIAATTLFSDRPPENFFWKRATLALDNYQDVSGRARLIAWDICLRMVAVHPVSGIGIGEFPRQFLYYRSTFFKSKDRVDYVPIVSALNYDRAHNEYLQVMVEGGLLAAIPLLLLILLLLIRAPAALAAVPAERLPLVAGGFCGLVAIMFDAMFSFPLHLAVSGSLFVILGSIVAPLISLRGKVVERGPWRFRDSLVLVLLGIMGLVSLAAIYSRGVKYPLASFAAQITTKQTRQALERQPPDVRRAMALAADGLAVDPTWGPLYFYRAQSYQALAHAELARKNQDGAAKFYAESIEACKKGIQYRTDASIFALWGIDLLEQSNFAEAYKVLKVAADLEPSNFQFLKLAGITAIRSGQPDEALSWLQHARDLNDDDPVVHQLMAAIEQRLGNDLETVVHLDALWRMRAKLQNYRISELDVGLNFADTHRKLGNFDIALSVLDDLMARYPADARIEKLRQIVITESGL